MGTENILESMYRVHVFKFHFLSLILFRAADILRTTKLALLRARLRRRCFQYRKSHKSNNRQQLSKNETTLALVKASKEGPKATVSVVKEMMHQQNKTVDR